MAWGGAGVREFDKSPTWAVVVVSAFIILISFLLEKTLHRLGLWFREQHKKALFEALEKVKSELMILGFISLLLTFGQNYFAKICIPVGAANTMLPCLIDNEDDKQSRRKLLWSTSRDSVSTHRFLADNPTSSCSHGRVPIISIEGLHELHIFIFFLTIFHVAYCALTMALGRLKIRKWKEWENETKSLNYQFSTDPLRFRLVHEILFVKQHINLWDKHPFLLYFACFFHQFFRSVRKADYLTLRNGFINVHLASGGRFDFQNYIKRSMEDDYKVVVEISPLLWASGVIFILLNVHGWKELFWVSLLPPFILLAVGTHLQAIIAKMAIEIKDRHAVIQGTPLVQLSDKHFWFNHPSSLLSLIHFTLFMNAFQLAYFFWIWYGFGLRSCFHRNFNFVITRVVIGVIVQFVCTYATLPLYALVSQMGSHMKRSLFDEQTNQALKKWHQSVRKQQTKGGSSHSISTNTTPRSSPSSSPFRLLHQCEPTGYSDRRKANYYSDQKIKITEMVKDYRSFSNKANLGTENEPSIANNLMPSFKHSVVDADTVEHNLRTEEQGYKDFTFFKSSTESKRNSQLIP